jgi:hypothetical protein
MTAPAIPNPTPTTRDGDPMLVRTGWIGEECAGAAPLAWADGAPQGIRTQPSGP